MAKTITKPTTVQPVTVQTASNKDNWKGRDLKAEYGSWSAAIRAMDADGLTRSEIADVTGKKYQHVRNVLITPVGQTKTNEE
jgi:hypothetical protein